MTGPRVFGLALALIFGAGAGAAGMTAAYLIDRPPAASVRASAARSPSPGPAPYRLPWGHVYGAHKPGAAASPLVHNGAAAADRAPVLRVQRRIGITPSGLFDMSTHAAVWVWQDRHGLSADGQVGPQTWAALFPRDTTATAYR